MNASTRTRVLARISCLQLVSASESGAEIQFNQIHKPSGKRIRYEKVVPGIGPVQNSDIVKGYQVEHVTIEPEEVEAIKLESKKTIDTVQFVDADQIDARYFERPYYIVPKDEVAAISSFARHSRKLARWGWASSPCKAGNTWR
jgi:Ku protein